jgi:hypothetical protein
LYDCFDGITWGVDDPGLIVENLKGMGSLGAAAPGTFTAEWINLDSGHVAPAMGIWEDYTMA